MVSPRTIMRLGPPSSFRCQFQALMRSSTFSILHLSRAPSQNRSFNSVSASLSEQSFSSTTTTVEVDEPTSLKMTNRWKPMCLYFTQGKCTMMDDLLHMEKFNHSFCEELRTDMIVSRNMCSQNVDFLLVLDLEGRIEILEFPILLINAHTMEVADFFHRFVRPSKMSDQRTYEYIEGKYGKFGVDRVWHDTAVPFDEVIHEFESWMTKHNLWKGEVGGRVKRAAFVTCGNWDIKTKIPEQCKVSGMKLPAYFMEWINIKDIYLNFYKRRATGMMTMLKQLNIQLRGSHHLGIDDTKNIAKVLQRMLADGALVQITARRRSDNPESVQFLFKDRIRTPCKYPGKNVAFHVNVGSTEYWLSFLVEFEDGDGDVGSMHIKPILALQSMLVHGTSGCDVAVTGRGATWKLSRQQLLQVLINSPDVQRAMYSGRWVLVSAEQVGKLMSRVNLSTSEVLLTGMEFKI